MVHVGPLISLERPCFKSHRTKVIIEIRKFAVYGTVRYLFVPERISTIDCAQSAGSGTGLINDWDRIQMPIRIH